MIIRTTAYPRAGLMGNPSDGYHGRTISFCFTNFKAEVELYETPELEIQPGPRDYSRYRDMDHLAADVKLFGYYGGIRLLKAAVKRFHDHCRDHGIELDGRTFTVRYRSNIPDQVGLAGSSAIVTACLRALMSFYGVDIPAPALAALTLSVETQELKISAGLQDRVAQAYEGLVFMDFDRVRMEEQGYGLYEPLPVAWLPPLYIAYRADMSEESGIFHDDLRSRYHAGNPDVVQAMGTWAGYATAARAALEQGDTAELGRLIDANFDLRRRVCRLDPGNLRMVEAARLAGATAKFTGSGGAIVGTYTGDTMYRELEAAMAAVGARTIRPAIAPPREVV